MKTGADEARDLLARLCADIGFPAPPSDSHALAAWADECLDPTLVRGSPPWRDAHEHVIDAFEGALLGNEPVARASLVLARDAAVAAGRVACSCPTNAKGHTTKATSTNRAMCVKCGGRA